MATFFLTSDLSAFVPVQRRSVDFDYTNVHWPSEKARLPYRSVRELARPYRPGDVRRVRTTAYRSVGSELLTSAYEHRLCAARDGKVNVGCQYICPDRIAEVLAYMDELDAERAARAPKFLRSAYAWYLRRF